MNHLKPHFNEADWKRLTADWQAWWAGELKRPMVWIEVIDPEYRNQATFPGWDNDEWDNLANLPLDLPASQVIDTVQQRLEHSRWYGDAFPKWWPNFAPASIAAFLGTHPEPNPETTWYHPLGVPSLADIPLQPDPQNAWYRRLRELEDEAYQRFDGQVTLGQFDMVGCLDLLGVMRGVCDLMVDLIEAPEQVECLLAGLTRLWLDYYNQYFRRATPHSHGYAGWPPIWFPGKGYMLQSDLAYLISPAMFERFVMPELEACCQELDYAFYHLDGKNQIPHLDQLLSLPSLRGIQWVPGDGQAPPEEWLPLLKRIREGGKLCQLFVTRQGARKIVDALGGEGFVFKIEETLTIQEAEEFLARFP